MPETKSSGVNLDELQEETKKLLALLEDRQTGLMSWHMLMMERLKSHHALTGKALGLLENNPAFKVIVDHELSRKDMIAAGKHDWVNEDITEKHFPRDKKEGKEKVDLELVYYNRVMTSEQVLSELKNRGYRPATLSELLAFGVAYPEKQREFPIVALGSVWLHPGSGRFVPCLFEWCDERCLSLGRYSGGWHGDYRFLAVRKS